MSQLYASLFYQQDVTEIFSDRALVKYMIETEVALAQAQAAVGVIPQSAADIITFATQDAVEKIDFQSLAIATGLVEISLFLLSNN